MTNDGYNCERPPVDYAVAFLTAEEISQLDADPVLEPRDYWRDGGPP